MTRERTTMEKATMPRNLLEKSSRILLVSHVQPDGDAIGSLLGLGLSLRAKGKSIVMYNEDPVPASFAFLPGADLIVQDAGDISRFDTLIVLDSGDAERMGNKAAELKKIPAILNIDHHPSNTEFGTHNLIDTDAASTTVMIWRLLKEMQWTIPGDAAWGIYTGIFTDTGGFRFGNTNTEALSIAAEMTACGVHPETVGTNILGSYSFSYIRLLQKALASIRLCADGKLATMTLTRAMFEETGASEEEASGLVNYARYIAGVKMAVLIREKEEEAVLPWKVSMRADKDIDASAIAVAHGGGGHRAAAGFSTALSPDAILNMLENQIQSQRL